MQFWKKAAIFTGSALATAGAGYAARTLLRRYLGHHTNTASPKLIPAVANRVTSTPNKQRTGAR
ncbi:hypothetical protein [Hyphomonas pacifica]|uniref:Uncharacterized protein n=1 Tax=Hyphomonas pacifica TaxID=1280941 RepID=A0A062U3K3_9PROT|nr:hypothetical protein [Hyphomonas pacifica]KCZ51164.1 hypothetical protein HY2_12570 [Hyphomonas pacifica]RAN33623.1 hypothetical protein HY3_12670 [Hyphomonas pacifica]RAN37017.1 hypothetical protein HY11_10440 [Hyphomonas pacifica]